MLPSNAGSMQGLQAGYVVFTQAFFKIILGNLVWHRPGWARRRPRAGLVGGTPSETAAAPAQRVAPPRRSPGHHLPDLAAPSAGAAAKEVLCCQTQHYSTHGVGFSANHHLQ